MRKLNTMKEEFLHYVWRTKKFDVLNLKTVSGHPVEVLSFGVHNKDAGPDFLEARLRIGETIWVGDIEMHVKSSEWYVHDHHNDSRFNSVILHVVWQNDKVASRQNGQGIETLDLSIVTPSDLATKYQELISNESWIPCESLLAEGVNESMLSFWLARLTIERLEHKTTQIEEILLNNNNDWEQTYYRVLGRSMGLKVNSLPFEMLTQTLEYKILLKYVDSLDRVSALVFGQAGYFNQKYEDHYPNRLKKEYEFLKQKHQIHPIPKGVWRQLRMRPANFPTIRLAQFAQIIVQSKHLFSSMLQIKSLLDVKSLYQVSPHPYWKKRYLFDEESIEKEKKIGDQRIKILTINAVVPMMFLYGKKHDKEQYKSLAIRLLEELSPEQNNMLRQWYSLGIKASNASQSQALIQLKKEYCDFKKCLNCQIGHRLLNRPVD